MLNGTIFTQWSRWGADPRTKVQWDTLETNGVLRSQKPEYDSIRACFPKTRFTYPDSWSSFSIDVHPYADVLMTIDEKTYVVPSGAEMGVGHPVMWAYHLPPDSSGNQGRFIYFARGHDLGAWDGMMPFPCISRMRARPASRKPGIRRGVLNVRIRGQGSHEVKVFTLDGKNVARRSGEGEANYAFANLRRPCMYIVEVKSLRKAFTQRVML